MEKAIKRWSPLFVLPTLLAFTIGFIIPFFEGLYLSFCQFTTVKNAKFTGFGNYKKIFSDLTFLSSFKFTVLFAVASIVLINVCLLYTSCRRRKQYRERHHQRSCGGTGPHTGICDSARSEIPEGSAHREDRL